MNVGNLPVAPPEHRFDTVDENLEWLSVIAKHQCLLPGGLAGPQEVDDKLEFGAVGGLYRAQEIGPEPARQI